MEDKGIRLPLLVKFEHYGKKESDYQQARREIFI